MKLSNSLEKSLASAVLFGIYFGASLPANAAVLNISQTPLILSETVAPNLILTLDDSGSMVWAFVPDSIDNLHSTRRAKAAYFNPMSYNPAITYRIPPKYETSGALSTTPFSTSFTTAYHNGMNPGRGSFNLNNGYRATWAYNPKDTLQSTTQYGFSNTSSRYAYNPTPDFYLDTTTNQTLTNGQSSSEILFNNIKFKINRISNTNCTATIVSAPATITALTCSRSNSTYTIRSTTDLRSTATQAYYYLYDEALPSCTTIATNRRADENCYKPVFVSTTSGEIRTDDSAVGKDERQNFAIWYSFYRNRALATLSAAQIAFAELPQSVRITWQGLGKCTSFDGSNTNCKDNKFREYNAPQKGQLFSYLQDPFFDQSTYLRQGIRRAGEFLKSATAWQKYPNDSSQSNNAGNTYSCRPSYHIVMTDGMWNDSYTAPSNTLRSDDVNFSLPDNTAYKNSTKPFSDSTTQTFADLAMHYWATDLNSGLDNGLQPYYPFKSNNADSDYWDPRNNPATWQHMVNFVMGLGLTNSLVQPGLEWDPLKGTFGGTGYDNLVSGAKAWPAAGSGSANNVYDLWHAAINSRGEFFSVDSPEDMVNAFKDILNRISDRTTSAARPAVSASFVSDADSNSIQSNVYATQFSSEDWSGELVKTLISSNGDQEAKWSAKNANQSISASTRKVFMKDANNSTTGFKEFTWSNLGSTFQSFLNLNPESLIAGTTDSRGQNRVAYIRGDRSNEGTDTTKFRKRSTILGDIINSSPVVVGTPSYLSYLADAIENPDGNRSGYQSYSKFREANHKSKRKEMIYVGGNDGMLHGFNAASGKEEFAYIPTEVIKNLYRLTGQNYKGGEHRFFVDGSPVVRDIYFGDATNEGWRTVLIGTLRAGGKALFALDITDPENIKLLWEFDSTSDSDLGFTFAQPEITRLHSGQWAVLMGNGYNSTSDKASLMVIDIKKGTLLKKLTVPAVVESGVTLPNGLSSVRGADNNGDGVVDYAYAGDLQGNLWRFDLLPTNASSTATDPFSRKLPEVAATTVNDFKIAYGDKPIFTARDSKSGQQKRQAITIQPSLVRHPTGYGYLVLIGTGKYFEGSDANVDTSRSMSLYGIWDRKTKRQTTSASSLLASQRSRLQKQKFTTQANGVTIGDEQQSAVSDIRLLSSESILWYTAPNPSGPIDPEYTLKDENVKTWGWALDLAVENTSGAQTLTGEMVVNNMAARGRTLFTSSLTPNQDPCKAGADTWLYGIDAHTGGRTDYNVLDLNNDKIVSSKDTYGTSKDVVSGVRFPAVGGFTLAPGNKVYGSAGASDPGTVGDDPNSSGRQSWHIVPEELQ